MTRLPVLLLTAACLVSGCRYDKAKGPLALPSQPPDTQQPTSPTTSIPSVAPAVRPVELCSPRANGGPETYAHVTAGWYHTCGIKTDGTLWCWGRNDTQQLGFSAPGKLAVPTQVGCDSDWVAVGAGLHTTCGLKSDGTLWCWGHLPWIDAETIGPQMLSEDRDWTALSVGSFHACGLKRDGTLWCWGGNGYGMLGDGTVDASDLPIRVTGLQRWKSVSAGYNSTCAIDSEDAVWCWGNRIDGQLGDGGKDPFFSIPLADQYRATPQRVSAGPWRSVSVGHVQTYAVDASGSLWCWGHQYSDDNSGDLLDSFVENQTCGGKQMAMFQTADRWKSAARGMHHTCALRDDGSLWCRGVNWYGALGIDLTADSETFRKVAGEGPWVEATGGTSHTCAIDTQGALFCWGKNDSGQLGSGIVGDEATHPLRRVASNGRWAALAVSSEPPCGLQHDGTLWCWGRVPAFDQANTPDIEPFPQTPGTSWKTLSATHRDWQGDLCGVKTDGTLWCWDYRPLYYAHMTPGFRQMGTSSDWRSVFTGKDSACGIRTEGALWCWWWGTNYSFATGDQPAQKDGTEYFTPILAGDPTVPWSSASIGEDHVCAIKADGTLWCWGSNAAGALGTGTMGNSRKPLQVGANEWAQVSASRVSTCALKLDGTLWCWGQDKDALFGSGSVGSSPVPFEPQPGTRWKTINTLSGVQSCGVQTDGSMWCWGSETYGEAADGMKVIRTTPFRVGTWNDWVAVDTRWRATCGLREDGSAWCWGSNEDGNLGDGSEWTYKAKRVVR